MQLFLLFCIEITEVRCLGLVVFGLFVWWICFCVDFCQLMYVSIPEHLYVTAGLGRQTPGEGKQPDPAYKQDPQSGRDNVAATQQLPATSACCQMIDIFFVIACIHT